MDDGTIRILGPNGELLAEGQGSVTLSFEASPEQKGDLFAAFPGTDAPAISISLYPIGRFQARVLQRWFKIKRGCIYQERDGDE